MQDAGAQHVRAVDHQRQRLAPGGGDAGVERARSATAWASPSELEQPELGAERRHVVGAEALLGVGAVVDDQHLVVEVLDVALVRAGQRVERPGGLAPHVVEDDDDRQRHARRRRRRRQRGMAGGLGPRRRSQLVGSWHPRRRGGRLRAASCLHVIAFQSIRSIGAVIPRRSRARPTAGLDLGVGDPRHDDLGARRQAGVEDLQHALGVDAGPCPDAHQRQLVDAVRRPASRRGAPAGTSHDRRAARTGRGCRAPR